MSAISNTDDNESYPIGAWEGLTFIAVATAFICALFAVEVIRWPSEMDFFRDIGFAQGILDSNWWGDPSYLNETRWYNPMLPLIYAVLAAITDLPLPLLAAKSGPILNLLSPIGFYIFAATAFGRRKAATATICYLYLGNHSEPSWFHATYSPWAWPMNFSQGFFHLAAAAYLYSLSSPHARSILCCGVLLGLTALSHTAPACILAITIFINSIYRAKRAYGSGCKWHSPILRLSGIGIVSFLISLPLLLPIFYAYRFQIVNEIPSSLAVFWGRDFLRNLVSIPSVIAFFGLMGLLSGRFLKGKSDIAPFVLQLFAVTTGLLLYSLLAQAARVRFEVSLPQLVPSFHFHLYFKAIESLLFGVGMTEICTRLHSFMSVRKDVWKVSRDTFQFASLAFILSFYVPTYFTSPDFTKFREEALRLEQQAQWAHLYNWIISNTDPGDVFLADDKTSVYAVTAAGRKAVSIDPAYSNPYVSYTERSDDRDRMYEALRSFDDASFFRIAEKYGVSYIVCSDVELRCPNKIGGSRFREIFRSTGLVLYALK